MPALVPLALLISLLIALLSGCATADEISGVWGINSFSTLDPKPTPADYYTRRLPPL